MGLQPEHGHRGSVIDDDDLWMFDTLPTAVLTLCTHVNNGSTGSFGDDTLVICRLDGAL